MDPRDSRVYKEYGNGHHKLDSRVFERRRRPVNLASVCFSIFFPWFLFCTLYFIVSFKLHYDEPWLAWLLVFSCFSIPIAAGVLGWKANHHGLDATWYIYAALACFLAVSLAAIVGNLNYTYNTKLFYSVETLNTYPLVNADRAKGSQLMDAGRVTFTPDTGIDMRRAMGFKSVGETYCVAPIVTGKGAGCKGDLVDFWAVGVDCCSGVASDFRCGDYMNPHAHSGLRLVRDDQRPFYRLAVQQAEAAYGIKAAHPLFFHWTQDPVADTAAYRDAGLHYFLSGVWGHFFFNLLCVAVAVFLIVRGKY